MTGRNDPCPCGSGKKYKKCCLRKDKKAEARQAQNALALPSQEILPDDLGLESFEERDPNIFPLPVIKEEDPDPLMERKNAFWEQFMEASDEEKWDLATHMLMKEPELYDDEIVFEIGDDLFQQVMETGEIERYQQLLNQFAEKAAEAYEKELQYILEWRAALALREGNDEALAHHFYQFSPLAGDKIDTYYRIVKALRYHGKLDILYQGMRQARPFVAEGDGLVHWAYDEFVEKLATLAPLYLLERNPHLTIDDPTLQQHMAEYEIEIKPESMSLYLDYLSGRKTPDWQVTDFTESDSDSLETNPTYLLTAFVYYAHHVEGIVVTRAQMAREELNRYFLQQREKELGEAEDDYNFRPTRRRKRKLKGKPKKPVTQHPLVPDAKMLDEFMGRSMGFLSFNHYEMGALFELMPTWLRFLCHYHLLEDDVRQQTLKALHYLKEPFMKIVGQLSAPVLPENLLDWPYEK